jgi:integrase
MREFGFQQMINSTTLSTPGVDVSPHLFRASAASTAAMHGGGNPYLAAALLDHVDPTVTNDHHNRASSASAAMSLRDVIRN